MSQGGLHLVQVLVHFCEFEFVSHWMIYLNLLLQQTYQTFNIIKRQVNLQIYDFATLRVCDFTVLRVCGFTDLRVCDFTDLRVCGFTDLRVAGLQFYDFATLRVAEKYNLFI